MDVTASDEVPTVLSASAIGGTVAGVLAVVLIVAVEIVILVLLAIHNWRIYCHTVIGSE